MGTDREIQLRLPAHPGVVGSARDAVEGLRGTLPDRVIDPVQLIVSELVTNAIRHAGASAPIELRVTVTGRRVRVEVRDPGRGFRRPRSPRPRGTGGYGLVLVDRLADRWGVDARGRTRVWAELASA